MEWRRPDLLASLSPQCLGGNLQRQNICLENKLSQALGKQGEKYDFGSFNKQGFMRTVWFLLDALGLNIAIINAKLCHLSLQFEGVKVQFG